MADKIGGEPSAKIVTPILFDRVLDAAGEDVILVGGQALSTWLMHFGIDETSLATTVDIDFIGTRADVKRIARGIGGKDIYPHEKALTALVGQVRLPLSERHHLHVDVMFRVFGGLSTESIAGRAVRLDRSGRAIRVLHPMDVLQGRLENVYGIQQKQDAHGIEQLRMAIDMVKVFLQVTRANSGDDRPVLRHINRIEEMAMMDAGRKVAERFSMHVADAIVPEIIQAPDFHAKRLPQLAALMSSARRHELGLPDTAPPGVPKKTVRASRKKSR